MEAALKAAIATGLIPPMEKAPLPPPAEEPPAMDPLPPPAEAPPAMDPLPPPAAAPPAMDPRISGGGGIFVSSKKYITPT